MDVGAMVEISSDVLARIAREAADSLHAEVCGLLFGTPGRIADAQACRNVAADPSRWFEIDPAALIAAHRLARNGGPQIVGHYHSHPSGRALPSPRDAIAATPDGGLWLIATHDEVRAWRAVIDGPVEDRFAHEPLTLIA